ncbi:MAG: ABC transporter substrate-binding protein [Desulfovermiculus sp.]
MRNALLLCFFVLIPVTMPVQAAESSFALKGETGIVDQAGRRIQVNTPMQRIISLYGAHTENLYALGLDEEIIGVSRHEVFPPKALDKPAFAAHQDLERFLAVDPDCVLIRPMLDRGYPQLVEGLERLGIEVISLQPNTVQEITSYWRALGRLTGRQEAAEGMIESFTHTLDRFQKLNRDIDNPKQVYFEAIHAKMKTFAPSSIAVFVLESVGGKNVAADAKGLRGTNIAAYGKEKILSKAQNIDVYLAQKGPMNRPTKALIRQEPGFQSIKAVRNDKIFIVDEFLVSRPTFRLLLGMARIGHLLYPEIYTQEVVKDVQVLVNEQYGLPTQEQP